MHPSNCRIFRSNPQVALKNPSAIPRSDPHLAMLFITAFLMALSFSASAGCGTLDLGLIVSNAVSESPHLSMPSFNIWMLVVTYVLFIKVLAILALAALPTGPRPSIPSTTCSRWLFVMVLLSIIFATSVSFPYDAFHYLARQLPAAASLWSIITYGITEPAPIRYCFDKIGNLTRLLDPTKEALYLRCSDVSALFESLETTPPIYKLTFDHDKVYSWLSCFLSSTFDVDIGAYPLRRFYSFSSSLRLSWLQVFTFAVLVCLIVIAGKLYGLTLELKAALEKREEESCMGAEYSRQERAFYRKRVSTLRTTNAGLIAALDSAIPKIAASDLQCAQARAHANQIEVALVDLKDAHADEVRTLKTTIIASEAKAAKASAHARSLMKTSRAQRCTISSLRASSVRLAHKCSEQDATISALSSRNEQLETMVHHLRIGIAKLASISQKPESSALASVSDIAEEVSEAVGEALLVDYEEFLNFASFQDSLSDFVDEEELVESSEGNLDTPTFVISETPTDRHLPDSTVEPIQQFDAEIERLCNEIQDLRPSDSFLMVALADVLALNDNSHVPSSSSDLSSCKMFGCLSQDEELSDTATTCNTADEVSPLPLAPVASESSSAIYPFQSALPSILSDLASFGSSPLLTHVGHFFIPYSDSPAAAASPSAIDTQHPLSASKLAPFGYSPASSTPLKDRLFEGTFGGASLGFASDQNTFCLSEPISPVRSLRYPPPFTDRQCQWDMSFVSRQTRAPITPKCAFKGKVKASITASTRKFLANKENLLPF